MPRPHGGYLGFNRVPAASAFNSAASGVWTLREAEAAKRGGTWPTIAAVPQTISGLALWLDAADPAVLFDATTGGSLVAADGGVARWEDKSGNGRHATQATSGDRPARKTSVQGGKDVLRFDGSNDFLSIPSSTATFKFLHSADSTVFVVFKSGTTANPGHAYYAVISTFSSATANTGFILATYDSSPSNDALEVYASRGVGGTTAFYQGANDLFPSNTFALASTVARPTNATAANRISYRKNGGTPVANNTSTDAVSTADSQGNLTIGNTAVGSAAFLSGDIAEIIIYGPALSDTDRGLVESYLMTKWGIT